jgi:hypothetical protein
VRQRKPEFFLKTKLHSLFIALTYLGGIHQTAATGTTVFPIETNPAVIAYGTGIAFDGTNYLVAGLTGTNSSEVTNVNVQLVSPSGTLIGSPIYIGGGAGLHSVGLLAFGQTNYLVAWSDSTISSGVDMFGQFISRTGAEVGSAFNLLASQGTNGFQTVKGLATDGTNFLVVWQDGTNNNLYGQLATPAGTLSGSEFLLASQLQGGASVAATFGKTNYFIVWQSNVGAGVGNSNQVYGQFVSVNGSAGSPFQISQTASTDQNFLALAFDGTNYLAVWPWDPGPETEMNVTNWQFYARLVSQSGALVGNELNLITNRNEVIPSLAFDGTDYLLTYGFDSNTTNSDRNLFCQFIDRSANLVGPSFTPFPTMQGTNIPAFALDGTIFNGNKFVIAATLGTLGINGEVYGTFIPASTSPPTLASTGPLVGTQFPLLLTGTPGINYAIQTSTNLALANWTALTTNSSTNGTFSFTDTGATNKSRFYRAVTQ